MDLSVNRLSKLQNDINFKGITSSYDNKNVPMIYLYPPSFDSEKEKVILEGTFLNYDFKTARLRPPQKSDLEEIEFDGYKPIALPGSYFNEANGFGYRFKIVSKDDGSFIRYALDPYEKINIDNQDENNKEQLNVIDMFDVKYEVTPKAGNIRHCFIDSLAAVDKNNELAAVDKNFIRNHFNKLKGSLKGMLLLLKTTDIFDPYRYILSNPDIGVDSISSHKYWPENLYQCSDMETFKDFNFELYKRGKGYIADGAFTSQGIQSPLVQHAMKWGEQSPWFDALRMDEHGQYGIIPDNGTFNADNPLFHIGVRIVNNPNKIPYDVTKPVYLQFYDDRLSSIEQQQNTKELISAYDGSLEDHYEIATYYDSIYPFYFEIDPSKYPKKIKEFKDTNAILLSDLKQDAEKFLTFDNYCITTRVRAKSATYWDGNFDLIKFNLSNPLNPEMRKGMKYAKEYLLGVPAFWSETIQSHLILETAKMNDKEKKETALANDITKEDYEEIKKSIKTGDINSPVIDENKKVSDYLANFPIQSIETSPELSAIFAQKEFKELLFDDDTKNKLISYVNYAIDNAIPEKYKGNSEYKTYVVKCYANQIIKSILAGAMGEDIVKPDGTIDLNKLKNVNIVTLKARSVNSVEKERKKVAQVVKSGIKREDAEFVTGRMKRELDKISLEDFKLAESIVIQGKAGLNWRYDAAKDIGDLDSVRAQNVDFKDIFWKGSESVNTFLHDFSTNIRNYHPSALIISELTDAWSFYNDKDPNSMFAFDDHGAKLNKKTGLYETDKNPDVKEREMIRDTRVTTDSNYSKYFNKLSQFIGTNPENKDGVPSGAGNLEELAGAINNTLNAQPNDAINSHMFFDNHDKPRLLHVIPLDMDIFLMDKRAERLTDIKTKYPDKAKKIEDLFGEDFWDTYINYRNISSKAVAVALMINRQIDNTSLVNNEQKKALKTALVELAMGKKDKDANPDFTRSSVFGCLNYLTSVKDMFLKAGLDCSELGCENLDDFVLKFVHEMLGNSMKGLEHVWQMMNAIPGAPTLYEGTEFAQTGYEERNKNSRGANRERTMLELRNNDLYKDFYKKMQAISSLYKQSETSALRGGFTTLLKTSKVDNSSYNGVEKAKLDYFTSKIGEGGLERVEEFFKKCHEKNLSNEDIKNQLAEEFTITRENNNEQAFIDYYEAGVFKNYYNFFEDYDAAIEMLPVYNYDEKGSQTISLITNNGVPKGKRSYKANFEPKQIYVESIDIHTNEGNCPLEENTELRKKIYNENKGIYEDEPNEEYIVHGGKIVNKKNKPILIDDTVVTFYAPKRGSGVAFKSQYYGAH